MDKKHKTRWEIKIRRIEVFLVIIVSLLFAVGFWLVVVYAWCVVEGGNKVCVESVNVDVTDGKLTITFTPDVKNPKISGLEILPQTWTAAREFRPEFLNRVDDVIIFQSLDESELSRIVEIQIAKLEKRLAQQNLTLDVDAAAKKLLAQEGYDPQFGARPLKRVVQEQLLNPLSELKEVTVERASTYASIIAEENAKMAIRLANASIHRAVLASSTTGQASDGFAFPCPALWRYCVARRWLFPHSGKIRLEPAKIADFA